jgi:hypothetical protein
VLIWSLEGEFHWSRATISFAVGVKLLLYGAVGPFAAALMDCYQNVKLGTILNFLALGVTDQYANAVSGATINFSDGGADGTFSSTTATTNLGGTANTTYTAPSTPQVVHISATVTGLAPAIFTETVHP